MKTKQRRLYNQRIQSNYPKRINKYVKENLSSANVLALYKNFKKINPQGTTDLTIEFYEAFWTLLGAQLVETLKYSFQKGELTNSQRQAIIKVIEKKDKDRRYLKNWRPISLINVDAKIGSKALALRLQKVLPDLIGMHQHAYVENRSIYDAVRSIDDILEFTKSENINGLLVAIDFQKAFDSLTRNFLFNVLEHLNFGKSFITWIKVFNTNLLSCVMNNGHCSASFNIESGVPQGDPLSPYLFIIALEILANYIRENRDIKGISIDNNQVKLSIFADDLTVFLQDKKSMVKFGKISGLVVNE